MTRVAAVTHVTHPGTGRERNAVLHFLKTKGGYVFLSIPEYASLSTTGVPKQAQQAQHPTRGFRGSFGAGFAAAVSPYARARARGRVIAAEGAS